MVFSIFVCAVAAASPVYEMTEAEVDAYVRRQSAEQADFRVRLHAVVEHTLGTPYFDGPLGEGPGAAYDADPLIDLKRVDCVTYVEQAVALATASSYEDLVARLQAIRYKDGVVDYEARNHFMISDWVRNNPWCREVTADLGVATETVTRTISRKDFFELVKAPGLGADTPDETIDLKIVPSARVKDAEAQLPDLALIVFVGKVDWLFSLHCGLYVRDETGAGHLVHASSAGERVVKMDLTDYVTSQGGRYIGITTYEISEPPFPDPAR